MKAEAEKNGAGIFDYVKGFYDYGRKQIKQQLINAKDLIINPIKATKRITGEAKDYVKAVVFGATKLPPNARNILHQYGDKPITDIVVCRNPVGSLLTGALNAVSLGAFKKEFSKKPYDQLYHLYLWIKVEGTNITLEKNEVITMDIDASIREGSDTMKVAIPDGLTLNAMMANTESMMKQKFLKYSAKDNNCQDFVLAVLKSNGLGDDAIYSFVKQDTKSLFANDNFLRKVSNTITDVGARVNTAIFGAGCCEGGALSKATKSRLVNSLQKTTKEEAVKDFEKLQDMDCGDIDLGKRTGAKFVDFFTMAKRLETTGNKGLSFFDLWEKKSELSKKKYVMNVIKYYKKQGNTDEVQLWYRIMGMYFGAVNIFKPIIAMDIYCRFNPTSVLDMTMGWGGRLVGACALNIPKYTGIDLNMSLKKPYEDMVKVLKEHSSTKITLMFKDALKVDYSKLDYDLVLTSPPYYNVEIYEGTKRMSEEEWDKTFYEPLFKKSWAGLKEGGHYCLNVPVKVYDRVLVSLLGKADQLIPMTKLKTTRPNAEDYKEFIYVWKKTSNKKIGEGLGKIKSSVNVKDTMANKWITFVKAYANDKGISYSEALKDPNTKALYKKGGGFWKDFAKGFTKVFDVASVPLGFINPALGTAVGGVSKGIKKLSGNGMKKGKGMPTNMDAYVADAYDASQLGANAGKDRSY